MYNIYCFKLVSKTMLRSFLYVHCAYVFGNICWFGIIHNIILSVFGWFKSPDNVLLISFQKVDVALSENQLNKY